MVEWARWFLSELPLFVLTAIATHLVVSGSQTLFHYGLGHHRLGGIFYRNHIRFHHTHYARGRLVSSTHRRNEGNNTPYFLIPTILVAGAMLLLLPFDRFVAVTVASTGRFGNPDTEAAVLPARDRFPSEPSADRPPTPPGELWIAM
jgi:hypothetical protein